MPSLSRVTRGSAELLLPRSEYTIKLQKHNVGTSLPPVFLTFDDRPNSDRTNRILDQLSNLVAKATFIVIGENSAWYPETVRRAIAEGHSIETRGWRHPSTIEVSTAGWLGNVRRARTAVKDIIGQECRLFRPTFGGLTHSTLLGLLRSGLRVIHWCKDGNDHGMDSAARFRRLSVENTPIEGSNVLMHDNQTLPSANFRGGCAARRPCVEFRIIPMVQEQAGHG